MQAVEYVSERNGELHVAATRVTLRSVIEDWKQGRTPEQVTEDYPSVPLAVVYGSIATYLERRAELDQRFAEEDAEYERARAASQAADSAFHASVRERIAKIRPRIEAELRAKGYLTETPADQGANESAQPPAESPDA
jgi:uncharacterized protein (DUF433 family)